MSGNLDVTEGLALRIDGAKPLSLETVREVEAVCGRAEALGGNGVVAVHVFGAPEGDWTRGVDVALVSKWERALRRLERLGSATVAIASGDVGGTALDALLATDYRIATPDTRLLVVVEGDATWPGMAVYRLTQQAGFAAVRRAVLFGHPILATEGVVLRLLHELTDETDAALALIAETASGLAGKELAIRRRLMTDATTMSFEDALGPHLAACDRQLRQTLSGAAI